MSNLSAFVKEGLIYKGQYVNSSVYRKNDVVTYALKTYVCKVATTTLLAPDVTPANWDVMAQSSTISAANSGSGTNPTSFYISAAGSTLTLNKVT